MAMSIHGKEYVLKDIFGERFAFRVPLYQRPYAWTEEQAGELLDDLLSSFDGEGSSVEESSPYFLGSIVLVKSDDQTDSEIVDGQQRLITLTILLSALRTTIDDTEFAEGITHLILEKGNKALGTLNEYRVRPRQEDEEFFEKYIQKPNSLRDLVESTEGLLPDSQKNVRQNAVHFLRELEKMSQDNLQRFFHFVARKTTIVVVSTEDRNSAYRIFSVLNSRGLDLRHSDILKADILGGIAQTQQAEYAEKWTDLEDELGRDAFQSLFAHVTMIFRKSKLEKTVLEEFRGRVIPDPGSDAEFRTLVDDVIKPYGSIYGSVITATYESTNLTDEINDLLKWLNRIDNADWIPPALLWMRQHSMDPQAILQFLKDLERLAAAMMIARRYSTPRIRRYGEVLSWIEDGKNLGQSDSPLQLGDEEKRDVLDKLSGPIYRLPRVPSYVMLRLDSLLSDGSASYDYSVVSIEHVLPQSPEVDSKWLEWFPDEQEREQLTHCLGNLVLLSRKKNSSASNREFDWKKNSYFTSKRGVSPFAITSQVLKEDAWTPDTVRARQDELICRLKQEWRLQ